MPWGFTTMLSLSSCHFSFRQVGDTAKNGSAAPAEEETRDPFSGAAGNSLTCPTTTPSLLAYNPSISSAHRDPPKPPRHVPAPDATLLNNQQQQGPQPVTDGSFQGQGGRTSLVPSAVVSPNNAATAKSPSVATEEVRRSDLFIFYLIFIYFLI